MEWIKCSERMPINGEKVLAWHIEDYPLLAAWEEDREPLYISPCGNYAHLADRWRHVSQQDECEPEGSFTHWVSLDWKEIKKETPKGQNDNEMFVVIENDDLVFAWWDSLKESFLDAPDSCIRCYMNPTNWMPIPAPPTD